MTRSASAATRRAFLALTAGAAPAALIAAAPTRAQEGGGFAYEVVRTEREWRDMLDETAYGVLREGGTERPGSSPLVTEEREGLYHCRGCELPVYESAYKVVLANYVFFYNAVPDAMLMGIDTVNPYGAGESAAPEDHLIEVHCRRCGSHHGHVLKVLDKALHCINGAALDFRPAEA